MKSASDLRIPFVWAERRSVLLDRCLYIPGFFDRHEQWEIVPWNHLFDCDQPVVIEYCSGNGQWICEKAREFPQFNWVAVEMRFDRARKIWARMMRESIPNLFVVCGEGVAFTRHYVPLQSVSQMFINFPDPWPKLRHAKHRIIRKEFFDEVEKILLPSGKATLVTDDFPYATQMLQVIRAQPKWKSLLPAPHFVTEWPDYGASFFCDLWKEKGRSIYYLHYEIIP